MTLTLSAPPHSTTPALPPHGFAPASPAWWPETDTTKHTPDLLSDDHAAELVALHTRRTTGVTATSVTPAWSIEARAARMIWWAHHHLPPTNPGESVHAWLHRLAVAANAAADDLGPHPHALTAWELAVMRQPYPFLVEGITPVVWLNTVRSYHRP